MTKIANINIIVAADEKNLIGNGNGLPWNLPDDLRRFKHLTSGSPVLMGRKTWESLPEPVRPLPNRTNIVITRNKDFKAEGAEVRHDLREALDEFVWDEDDLWVIGGAQIYKEAFKYANQLYLTRVYGEHDGDTYLEGLVPSDWLLIGFEGPYFNNQTKFRYEVYKKK